MSDSHLLDSLKALHGMMDDMKETSLLQPPQCAPEPVEVPPGFVFPEPVSMLPTMQAHLDILSKSMGLPPVPDE